MARNLSGAVTALLGIAAGYGAFKMQEAGLDHGNFLFYTLIALMGSFYVFALHYAFSAVSNSVQNRRPSVPLRPTSSAYGMGTEEHGEQRRTSAVSGFLSTIVFAAASAAVTLAGQQAILKNWFPYDASEGWLKPGFMAATGVTFLVILFAPLAGGYVLGAALAEPTQENARSNSAGYWMALLGWILGLGFIGAVWYVLTQIAIANGG